MSDDLTPAARYAEAPPADPAHPAVVERVLTDMADVAGWIDRLAADVFATDRGWAALQGLAESVEAAQRHAEMHRPTLNPTTF